MRTIILIAVTSPFVICGCTKKAVVKFNPPVQKCTTQDATHQLCTTREDGMVSGAGSNWSDEYYIKSDAPVGYKLESAAFSIPGDHPCHGDDTHPGAEPHIR